MKANVNIDQGIQRIVARLAAQKQAAAIAAAQAAKQPEIEFVLTDIPSVLAGQRRVFQDRHRPLCGKFAKFVASKEAARLMNEFDIA